MNIYYTDITGITSEDITLISPFLSSERRERITQFMREEDKKRSVCAELLLDYSIKRVVGKEKIIVLSSNKYGKPLSTDPEDFFFNISHSGRFVVIVAGDSEVGIDIEEIRADKNEDVVDCFAEKEKRYVYIDDLTKRKMRFIKMWTMKESFVKYLGTGLSTDFRSFCINPYSGEVDYQNISYPIVRTWIFEDDYYLSLCGYGQVNETRKIDYKDLICGVMKNENSVGRGIHRVGSKKEEL